MRNPPTHSQRCFSSGSLYKPIHHQFTPKPVGAGAEKSRNLTFEFSTARLEPSASHADFAANQFRGLAMALKHSP